MAQFTKATGQGTGTGVPDQNRPAATTNGPGTYDASAGSKMVTSKAYSPIGPDAVKSLAQGGQTLDKIGVTAITEEPAPPGELGNVASGDPAGFMPPANVISPGTKNRPGKQTPTIGAKGTHAAGGVLNVRNPAFGPRSGVK